MPNVIVTGADRGLGFSLCREFLARGWTVFAGKFLQDYNLLEQEREKNPALKIVPLDIGDRASIEKARNIVREQTGALDMIISNAALMGQVHCSIDEPPLDLLSPWDFFRVNALGPTHLVEYFLPLLDNGKMKRLCFVSSEVSSITLMKHRAGNSYPYPMSKSSLNMSVRLMHNLLYPEGYTFRLYHPGWMKRQMQDGTLSEFAAYDPAQTAVHAAKYFETPLGDEHRLVMYDYKSQEWPF
ncbi:MAG: SDR family NAD(P)-dependent oxidoreductase [Treponema sp.]|jgi:NAD(P)-dependent dehydrogenase (short-subunit alcohol dehydrogenase family)|nr:SDR family NAD(P)-dependent oxidoreductase [Treponema sp.]